MSEWHTSSGGGIKFRYLTPEEEAKIVLVAEVDIQETNSEDPEPYRESSV